MRRVPPLLLGVLITAVLAGCGQSNPKLIPQSNADALNQTVASISTACSSGDRSTARDKVTLATQEIAELPRAVDPALVENLKAWVKQIHDGIKDCKGAATPTPSATETDTPTSTPTPTATQSATPTSTPTPTASATATASPTATASATPTASASPAPTTTQNGNGGVPAPTPDG